MRKLIEKQTETSQVICDNPKCDYEVPLSLMECHPLYAFIDAPCPVCGENLLTSDDYKKAMALDKAINFTNKWFSWITIFYKKDAKGSDVKVHIYNGVEFSRSDGSVI